MPANAKLPGLTFERMMSVERLTDVAVSPDGRQALLATSTPELDENRMRNTIHLLDLETGEQRELTPGPGNHAQPAWSPDGRRIAFVSDRGDQGTQLWVMPATGGEARAVTRGHGGAERPLWAPDSRRIAFARRIVVSADYEPKKNENIDPKDGPPSARVYGLPHPQSSAQIADELLFRHWDAWRDRRRNHVFVADVQSDKMTDVTPGDRDAPPISLGSTYDYAWSPDGRELAFVTNPDPVVARSTNLSIFVSPMRGIRPTGSPRCVSETSACDSSPRYSADGRHIVYLGMEVPGYEADRRRLKVYDRETGTTRTYLARFDRSPAEFFLNERGALATAHFVAEDRGLRSIYRLDFASGTVIQLTTDSYHGLIAPIPGSDDLLVSRETTTQPADLYRVTPGRGVRPDLKPGPPSHDGAGGETAAKLTRFGDALGDVEMNEAEAFWYEGDGSHPVHGFLIRPRGFNPRRKYPLVLLIHGGPQGAFGDHFHYRWNYQLFASRGAVVAYLNPRGSTGYGQKFTDQIVGDWGGRCYRDIMLGVDHLIATYPFIDGERLAAAGASFGGFMVNWIAGHSQRFKALVSHDGVFFGEAMAYTTEELWFSEYEARGFPHENRRAYLKYSPHLHVDAFATPTLVIHGGLDYRCPISEGLGLYTALQVKGVPSRLVHFPDEGHWILKPANAQVWYDQVLSWLTRYLA